MKREIPQGPQGKCASVCGFTRVSAHLIHKIEKGRFVFFPSHSPFSKRPEEIEAERLDHLLVRAVRPIGRGPENATEAP